MYFLFSTETKKATCFLKPGAAAKEYCRREGLEIPDGVNPVSVMDANPSDSLTVVNIQAALNSIRISDDGAAQELAGIYEDAVKEFYGVG